MLLGSVLFAIQTVAYIVFGIPIMVAGFVIVPLVTVLNWAYQRLWDMYVLRHRNKRCI